MTGIPAFAGKWKDRSGNAPTLQVWDGTTFVPYMWCAPACTGLDKDAWIKGAVKADVGPTTMLKAGDAVWMTATGLGTGSGEITLAGSVKTEDTAIVTIRAGEWSMGSNPYPMAYAIKDIVPSFAAFAGKWKDRSGNSPTLQTWDGTTFVPYMWCAPACTGLAKDAWVTGTTKAETTDTIPAGAGFWFKNVSGEAGTLTFSFKN